MFKTKKDMYLIILMFVAIFGFWYLLYDRQLVREEFVMDKGNFYFGKVTRLVPLGNSGGNRVYYTVFYNGKRIKQSKNISKPYWLTLEENDTILVKAIISDTLKQHVVIEEQQFIDLLPCLKDYEQPSEGFRELPCKVK